jgi:hypothetical protein
MKFSYLAAAAILAGGTMGYFWPAEAQSYIPMDNPIQIDGVETVCTGIGDEAQHDPRWLAYPIRIEFSNGGAQYLSGAHVVLSAAGGKTLSALDCAGSWVLFKLPGGNYKVAVTLLNQQGGGERTASFSPPIKGQKRVVLDFRIKPNQ